MQIHVKLMGALKEKEPPKGVLKVSEDATIEMVLGQLEITPQQVQIVMVNSRPQPNRTVVVNANDELTILAPVGGG